MLASLFTSMLIIFFSFVSIVFSSSRSVVSWFWKGDLNKKLDVMLKPDPVSRRTGEDSHNDSPNGRVSNLGRHIKHKALRLTGEDGRRPDLFVSW